MSAPVNPCGELLLGDVLRTVARDDVPHLVAEHARQLALGLEPRQERLGDEDGASGKRERIHGLRIVEQGEVVLVRRARRVALLDDPRPHRLHGGRGLARSSLGPPNSCIIWGVDWSPSAISCSGVIATY